MPKKFGVNSKQEEARQRKNEQKKEVQERNKKEKEDAEWTETDPKILAKLEKKKTRRTKEE